MTKSPEKLSASRSSRRGFLKGTALALPAATTLTPAIAQAMTSITCGQKSLDNPESYNFITASDDGLMRVDVSVYDYTIEESVNGVVQPVAQGEKRYFKCFGNSGEYYRYYSDGTPTSENPPADLGPELGMELAIVHIDAVTGEAVSQGAPETEIMGTNAIVTSAAGACMNSLMQNQF